MDRDVPEADFAADLGDFLRVRRVAEIFLDVDDADDLLHGEAADDENAGEHFVEAGVNLRPALEKRALAPHLLGRGAHCDEKRERDDEENRTPLRQREADGAVRSGETARCFLP